MFESRFQSFVELGDPSHGRDRVGALRAELAKEGLAGFIVPRADEHQNEYVPPNAERLRWLTGFAGSAGIAVVLKDAAALFVDGRYTAQVKTQADGSVFEFRHVVDEPPTEWITKKLKAGDKLGYDSHLHTPDAVARFAAACERAGAGLVAVDFEPDRRHLGRSAAAAARPDFAACDAIRRRKRARKNRPGAESPDGGRAPDQRPPQPCVAVQHSRIGRLVYAAAARLCLSAGRGTSACIRRRQKADGGEPPGSWPSGGDP